MAEFAQSINFTMQDKLLNIGFLYLMSPPFNDRKHMDLNNFYTCQKSERHSTNKTDNYCENIVITGYITINFVDAFCSPTMLPMIFIIEVN